MLTVFQSKRYWTWFFQGLSKNLTIVERGIPYFFPFFTQLGATHFYPFFTRLGATHFNPFFYPIRCDPFLPSPARPLWPEHLSPAAHPISSAYVTRACVSQHFSSRTTFNRASTFTGHPTPDPISTTCVSLSRPLLKLSHVQSVLITSLCKSKSGWVKITKKYFELWKWPKFLTLRCKVHSIWARSRQGACVWDLWRHWPAKCHWTGKWPRTTHCRFTSSAYRRITRISGVWMPNI